MTVKIPDWMEKSAPGAADAIRMIGRERLSAAQEQRLTRLTADDTRYAWLEPARNGKAGKNGLSEQQLKAVHFELMWEAYRAADFPTIGKQEGQSARRRLEKIEALIVTLANDLREVGNDAPLYDLWHLYKHKHRTDEILANMPHWLPLANALVGFADFLRSAAPKYNPEGPVLPVGQPKRPDALKTIVIRTLAATCEKHCGSALYGTVATLASASLGRNDITEVTVRGALRSPRT